MSLRHLTRLQNRTLADLLIGVAKAMGLAALFALVVPSSGNDWSLGDLIGVLVVALLLASLGISILGRVEGQSDSAGVGKGGPASKRRS